MIKKTTQFLGYLHSKIPANSIQKTKALIKTSMAESSSHLTDKEMQKIRKAAKKKKDGETVIVKELTSRAVKKLVEVPSPATLK